MGLRKLIAVTASLYRRTVHSVEPVRLISQRLVVWCIHIVRDRSVGIKMPRRLAVQHLLLVTVRARRARGGLIVIHVVGMVMTVHAAHCYGILPALFQVEG